MINKYKRFKSKQVILLSIIVSVLSSLVAPLMGFTNIVFAEATTHPKVIAAPGFFTKQFIPEIGNCEMKKEIAQSAKDKQTESLAGKGKSENSAYVKSGSMEGSIEVADTDTAKETNAVKDLMGTMVTESIVSSDEKSDKGMLNINCGQYSFLSWLLKLEEPVNITQSSVIMGIVYDFQIVALGIGVLLISIFGLYYALGNETTDPVKFLIRGFFVLWFVYYLPYFAQDILNINNMLSYWIYTGNLPNPSMVAIGATATLALVGVTTTIISAVITSMTLVGGVAGALVSLIVLAIVIGFVLKGIITILYWWYARFLMILFLVCLGPLFMIMMILPQTAHYGKNWIQYFIGEVFTQSSFAIAIYFAGSLTSQLGTLNKETESGLFGNVILLSALFTLLGKIPNISKSLIGKDIGGVGWEDAKRAGQAVGDFAKNAGMAVAGMTASRMNQRRLDQEGKDLAVLEEKQKELKMQEQTPEIKSELKNIGNNIDAIKSKQSERVSRGNEAKKFGAALNSGDFNKAMDDPQEQTKRGYEKAKGEINKKNEDEYKKQEYKLGKMAEDATVQGVEEDLQKERYIAEEAKAKADAHVDRLKENKQNPLSAEAEKTMRDANQAIYDSKMKDINGRSDKESVKAEARSRQEALRGHLENIAGNMLGNQFKSEFEKKAAVGRLADKLEGNLSDYLEEKNRGKVEKKGEGVGEAVENHGNTLAENAKKVADKFGISQARAMELLSKEGTLGELNSKMNELNDLNSMESLTEPQKQRMESLKQELGTMLGARPNASIQEISALATNKASAMQQEVNNLVEGNTPELQAKRAELAELNRNNANLLMSPDTNLNSEQREQKKQVIARRNQLETEIQDIVNANPNITEKINNDKLNFNNAQQSVATAQGDYDQKFATAINTIASNSGKNVAQSTSAINAQVELFNLEKEHGSLLAADVSTLTPEQQTKRLEVQQQKDSLDKKINSFVGGNDDLKSTIETQGRIVSSANANLATAQQTYDQVVTNDKINFNNAQQSVATAKGNYDQAFATAINTIASDSGKNVAQSTSAINSQVELFNLEKEHGSLLTADVSTLTPEQQTKRLEVQQQKDSLDKKINSFVGGNDELKTKIETQAQKVSSANASLESTQQTYDQVVSSGSSYQQSVSQVAESLGKVNSAMASYDNSMPSNFNSHEVTQAQQSYNQALQSQKQAIASSASAISASHNIPSTQSSTLIEAQAEISDLNQLYGDILTAPYESLSEGNKVLRTNVVGRQNALKNDMNTIVNTYNGNKDSLRNDVKLQAETISNANNDVYSAKLNYDAVYANNPSVPASADIYSSKMTSQVIQSAGGFNEVMQQIVTDGGQSFEQSLNAVGVKNAEEIVSSFKDSSIDIQTILVESKSNPEGQSRKQVVERVASMVTSKLPNASIETREVISQIAGEAVWGDISSDIPIETKLDTAFGGQETIQVVDALSSQQLNVETLTTQLIDAGVPNASVVAGNISANSKDLKSIATNYGGASKQEKLKMKLEAYDILKGINDPNVSNAVVESLLKGIQNIENPNNPDGPGPRNPNYDMN